MKCHCCKNKAIIVANTNGNESEEKFNTNPYCGVFYYLCEICFWKWYKKVTQNQLKEIEFPYFHEDYMPLTALLLYCKETKHNLNCEYYGQGKCTNKSQFLLQGTFIDNNQQIPTILSQAEQEYYLASNNPNQLKHLIPFCSNCITTYIDYIRKKYKVIAVI